MKSGLFAVIPPEKRLPRGPVEGSALKTLAFPHFFPQLWKTSGGDPTAAAREATVTHAFRADKNGPAVKNLALSIDSGAEA
jgi:hypothetical protein